ncbi:MAG: hypothetical protein K2Y39_07890 [Candidatus Obscuribacterales bacterium]|nr:hypothetical protein [Candidatus Obscuribacterales bacterium]
MAQDTIKDLLNAVAEGPVEGVKALSTAALDLSHSALDLMKENHYTIALAPAFPVGALIDMYRKMPSEANIKELDFEDDKLDKILGKELPSDSATLKPTGIVEKISPIDVAKQFAAGDARELSVKNMDKLLALTHLLPDGKYDAGMLKPLLDRAAGAYLDKDTAALITNISSLEKHGNHFDINFNRTTKISMGDKVPGTLGMVSVKNLTMDHLSFDVNSYNGKERLDNIKGMNVHYAGPTGGFDGNVKGLVIGRAEDGSIRYEATVTQNSTLARAIGVPGEFKAKMKADKGGKLVLTNEKEIEREIRKPVGF